MIIFLKTNIKNYPCSDLSVDLSIGKVWTAVFILLVEDELRGKVVWVTGASSGIGEELAYQLSKIGALLAISARREDELERVKKKCLRKYSLLLRENSCTLAVTELPQKYQPAYHRNKFCDESEHSFTVHLKLLFSFCEQEAFVKTCTVSSFLSQWYLKKNLISNCKLSSKILD